MKTAVFSLIICFIALTAPAQSHTEAPSYISPDMGIAYRLIPTHYISAFIKLDTRNGQLWQLQWGTDKKKSLQPLSLQSLVPAGQEKNGRFFLYPTADAYTFILADQLDGRTWQVTWSEKAEKRGISPIP
ncbi:MULTISPECIES: hypothetical protein [Flavobacterium]|uniref:hypothetical protein n=1 Tax=Flavobacterium TaxID=237 RepID=UPI00055286F5|nr:MULTISPECIES: hypothetical protein [Flavobacterium]OXG00571.1 hypothetical protein B0A63_08615 [Flavobacterium johnsoniae UW101]WQG81805.1 hypothetical protein SR927_01620 [Flavobacterium johnsoniae UW101]SHK64756.1 hypothetical protein SAMN05444146_1775 [Flavobacterium johnsoniae]